MKRGLKKRGPALLTREALAGGAAGAAAALALRHAPGAAPLLPAAAILGAAASGYLLGVVLGQRRRAAEDLNSILELREELRQSQDHIMENATFRSLGAYLEIAAHQMKGPLQAVTAGARALAGDAAIPGEARGTVGALRDQAEALEATLRHLAAYGMARPGRAPFSVNTLLREAILLCRHRAAEKSIVFEERYGVVPPVFGPASRVHQSILNVVVNAVEAMPFGGGTITVTTMLQDERVVARIKDTGIGIRPEHLPKVFDPFFTTKPEKKGVGLGLWTARQMLDIIGADVRIASAPFQGTEVTLTFPQAAPLRPGREGAAHPPELPRNTAEQTGRRIA